MDYNMPEIVINDDKINEDPELYNIEGSLWKFQLLHAYTIVHKKSLFGRKQWLKIVEESETYDKSLSNRIKRVILTEKVILSKEFTREEKEQLYYLITSKSLPVVKKGAPVKNERNVIMALEFLYKTSIGEKSNIIIKKLKKRYGICEEHAFYMALSKGKKLLKSLSEQELVPHELGNENGMSDNIQINAELKSIMFFYFPANDILKLYE